MTKYADQIEPGDIIYIPIRGKLAEAIVTSIESIGATGKYIRHTYGALTVKSTDTILCKEQYANNY